MRNKAFKIRQSRRRYKLKLNNKQNLFRLTIFTSNQHITGQIIDDINHNTVVSCSSQQKTLNLKEKSYNQSGALEIGQLLGEQAKNKGIKRVIVDVGGYKYHGRVKSLVEGLKESVHV